MRSARWWPLLPFLLGANVETSANPSAGEVIHYDWGPFAASWTDVHGNRRVRAAGPVFEYIDGPDEADFRAVRPFFSQWSTPRGHLRKTEVLWPVGTSKRLHDMFSWRFLIALGWDWDVNDPESRWRFWLFPFYFQGRDADGGDYLAVFPFGGSVHEFLTWDEIDFALFPLWLRSRKDDIEAQSWLWPFISRTRGDMVDRFRVFPFYGYNEREGRGRKTFVLWPFWTHVRYTYPASSGTGWILFPIAGHLKLADQETWWVLPPFFRHTRGEKQDRLYAPWPIIQKGGGETDKLYIFPLYGHKKREGVERKFFLWPLGHWEKSVQETGTDTRTFLVPFYQRFTREPSEMMEGERPRSDYTKVWPLFSHLSKSEGTVRRTVAPDLNPVRGGPVERNYAPFWQLWVREEVDGRVDTEVLWGLYRSALRGEEYRYRSLFPLFSWSREGDGGHFSILKGLLSRHVEADGKKRWRVLYLFTFGDTEGGEESDD